MIKASMLDLARTGQLGPLRCGLSKADLRTLLGDPPDWSMSKKVKIGSGAKIWRYGNVEFHFPDQAGQFLWMIFSDHDDLTDGGDAFSLDSWAVRKGISLSEFELELTQAGVQYVVEQPDFDPRRRLVVTSAKVTFGSLQEPEEGERSGLFNWSVAAGPSCPG
jgi:hypothetical protein